MEQREQTMVKELCEVEDGMNDKEAQFVEDLSHRRPDYDLSEKQLAWLEAIWNRVILKRCR